MEFKKSNMRWITLCIVKNKYLIFAILVLAFVLRLININQSLWLDEAIGALAVKNYNINTILFEFIKNDNHPPLYYLLLKFWTNLFSYSELSLRIPSIIFGLLTIYFTYKICNILFKDKTIGIISSLLLAFSQFHIYYSQEARMYSMTGFLTVFSIYYYIKIIINKNSHLLNYIFLSLGICSLIFTDYVPIFFIPFFIITPFFYKKSIRWWIKYLMIFIIPSVFGILWLPTFIEQTENGKWLLQTLPQWKNLAGGANIKQVILLWMKFTLGRISIFNKMIYYSIVFFVSIPFLSAIYSAFKAKTKETCLIISWIIIPVILGLFFSIFFPAFIYFRYMFVYPAFIILIALGISLQKIFKIKILLLVSILIINIFSLSLYYFDKNQQREDWKGALSYLESQTEYNSAAILVYPEPFAPFRWYTKELIPAFGVTDSISADPIKTVQKTAKIINKKNIIYYFSYLNDLTDPINSVKNTITKESFVQIDKKSFSGVGEIIIYKNENKI